VLTANANSTNTLAGAPAGRQSQIATPRRSRQFDETWPASGQKHHDFEAWPIARLATGGRLHQTSIRSALAVPPVDFHGELDPGFPLRTDPA
jgi:hypothetical protein